MKTYYEHETIFSSGDYKSGQQKRGVCFVLAGLLQCFLASLSEKIMRSNELRREAAAYDHNAVNGILEECARRLLPANETPERWARRT
ncbi:MAG: hypothetical protein V8S89_01395 [Oscillospiraceae bacterium]